MFYLRLAFSKKNLQCVSCVKCMSQATAEAVETSVDDTNRGLNMRPGQVGAEGSPAIDITTMPVLNNPLEDGVYCCLASLPGSSHSLLLNCIKAVLQRCGDAGMTLATACSGTDIVIKVFESAGRVLSHLHGIENFRADHVMSVEIEEKKRAFIRSQFAADFPSMLLLKDVEALKGHRAYCHIAERKRLIPYSHIFTAGFSCTSVSTLNNARAANASSIQLQTSCATADSFYNILEHIRSMSPMVVVLENVKELLNITAGLPQSDGDFVLAQLHSLGYWAAWFVLDAEKYGSIARRRRVYFLAAHLQQGMEQLHDQVTMLATNLIASMETGPGQVHQFVSLTSGSQHDRSADQAEEDEPPAKVAKRSANVSFGMEHLEIYADAGMSWPPDISQLKELETSGFTQRQLEVVYYLHTKWPASKTTPPRFVDVNSSLSRLVTNKSESYCPWSEEAPTLTSQSTLAIRYIATDNKQLVIRAVTGLELLNIIGWSSDMWAKSTPAAITSDNNLLTSLSGNAFSAFAVVPAIITALAAAGAKPSFFRAPCLDDAESVRASAADAHSDGTLSVSLSS